MRTTIRRSCSRRLLAYRDQTAPLSGYYHLQNVLRTVDGMATVEEVARSIDDALSVDLANAPPEEAAARRKSPARLLRLPRLPPTIRGRRRLPRPRRPPRRRRPAELPARLTVRPRRSGEVAGRPPARTRRRRRRRRNRREGRRERPHPARRLHETASPAEVDETPVNPLITGIQVETSNDAGPWGTGRVSRYRLRHPLT